MFLDGVPQDAIGIKHDFDIDYLIIMLEGHEFEFEEVFNYMQARCYEHKNTIMGTVNETNRYSFGKFHLKSKRFYLIILVGEIQGLKPEVNIYIRIILKPFTLETKKVKETSSKCVFN